MRACHLGTAGMLPVRPVLRRRVGIRLLNGVMAALSPGRTDGPSQRSSSANVTWEALPFKGVPTAGTAQVCAFPAADREFRAGLSGYFSSLSHWGPQAAPHLGAARVSL